MGFRLFGVDVEIQFSFWILAFIFTSSLLSAGFYREAIVIVGVIMVSILIHEYGHALAVKRHKIEPSIALHWRGGTTHYRVVLPLRRVDHVVISLAGPFAGFGLALLAFGVRFLAPTLYLTAPRLVRMGWDQVEYINFYWGLFNLLPVLPFDGGHVLEHALGPKRARMTAWISFVVGIAGAAYFVWTGVYFAAYFCGSGAMYSFQGLGLTGPRPQNVAARQTAAAVTPEAGVDLPPDLAALLKEARRAVADEELDRAAALAQKLLWSSESSPAAVRQKVALAALQVMGWARYLDGRLDEAEEAVKQATRIGAVDPALVGALLMSRQRYAEARRILEKARTAGDDRKEVVGPLIQVLLEQGEVARAAAVAFDVVESLSEDDARRMADLAFNGGAFEWSARLSEAMFKRERRAEDAYSAARAHAKHGDADRALEMLKRAVEAGFSDRARAWSDAALSSLREDAQGLEGVLPRP